MISHKNNKETLDYCKNPAKNQLISKYYEEIFDCERRIGVEDPLWENLFRLKPNREYFLHVTSDLRTIAFETIELFCSKCFGMFANDEFSMRSDFETVNGLYNYYMIVERLAATIVDNGDTNALKFYVNNTAKQSFLNRLTACLVKYVSETNEKDVLKARLALHILHIFAINYDYLNDNPIFESFLDHRLFEKLLKLLSNTQLMAVDNYILLTLIVLILTYRKHDQEFQIETKTEFANFDNCNAFNNLIKHLMTYMSDYCANFENENILQEPLTGSVSSGSSSASASASYWPFLSPLTSLMQSLFAMDTEDLQSRRKSKSIDSKLIGLTMLSCYYWYWQNNRFARILITDNGRQLIANFLHFLSILMANLVNDRVQLSTKLGFLIVRIWCENSEFCEFMFRSDFRTEIRLFRVPLQHRRVAAGSCDYSMQPLAVTLLDLIDEFIQTHLMKKLPLDLYSHCLRILHRIVYYKKTKSDIKLLKYTNNWNRLLNGLLNLMKFLVQNDSEILRKSNIFSLALQIVNILNMFIDGGEQLFDSIDSFNRFLYEIVRRKKVFLDFHTTAELYQTVNNGGGEYETSVRKLIESLRILMEIVTRIGPKIDQFIVQNNDTITISEPFMILIRDCWSAIRSESIAADATTTVFNNFEQFERFNRYAERAKNNDFFIILARNLIGDNSNAIAHDLLDAAVINFLTIFHK